MHPKQPGQFYDIKRREQRVELSVPCGKCISCASYRASQWSIRAYHEAQLHEKNCFITLTYDDENLPSDGKVNPQHLSQFWRDLRHSLPPRSIRYLACGEYGERTHRPHYHALIFGADFRGDSKPLREGFYTSPSVEAKWGHGLVDISSVTMATCCYVAGYVQKKINNPDTFFRQSLKPGIGHGWLDKYEDEIRAHGCVVIDGVKLPIPKKYMEWQDFDDIKLASALTVKPKKVSQRKSQHVNALSKFNSKQEKI